MNPPSLQETRIVDKLQDEQDRGLGGQLQIITPLPSYTGSGATRRHPTHLATCQRSASHVRLPWVFFAVTVPTSFYSAHNHGLQSEAADRDRHGR